MTGKKKIKFMSADKKMPGILIGAILFALVIMPFDNIRAQNAEPGKAEIKKPQFIDEDGDGFNDLLPDADGDGIPNLIDPDFKGHSAESLYMNRYMYGQTIEDERHQFQQMYQHGEPGQYGPGDSTGHGQRGEPGGHHGGPDGGMPGFNSADSSGVGQNQNPQMHETQQGNPPDKGNQQNQPGSADGIQRGNRGNSENEKGSGNQGGGGGRP